MKPTKPIRILFDANPLVTTKTGVGYYTYQLITALAAEFPEELELYGHYYNFLGLKKNLNLPLAPNITYRVTRLLPGKVFSFIRRKLHVNTPIDLLARVKADVLLFPNFTLTPSLFRTPKIVTIHDLYFMRRPDHINTNNLEFLNRYVPLAINNADYIIAVSEFTKSEIRKLFDVTDSQVLVTGVPVQDGLDITRRDALQSLTKMGISGSFVLFLGTIEPRKNVEGLLAAYRLINKNLQADYPLVLAGGKGWEDAKIIAAIEKARQDGLNVIVTGYVDDLQRRALYFGAGTVVIPSLYEGFGMQILESMSTGTPVVASDIPVFHEVAGDACLFADSNDPADLAKTITRILQDKALSEKLIREGKKQVKLYNWSNVAKEVYGTIERLVND